MSATYDIKQVTRYVLIKKGQKAVKLGFGTTPTATYDYDMSEFPRYADATMAAYALIRDQGAQHIGVGLSEDDLPNFEVQKVSRYVLTRSVITDKGDAVIDMAEFTRRDDAERVMGTMRAAIHPVETPKPVEKTAEQGAKDYIKIGDSLVITLLGLDRLDEINALEVLESRVKNTKKYWLMKTANQAGPQ